MSLLNLNSPAGRSPRGKNSSRAWMGFGLVIAVLGIGSTFAAQIGINNNNQSEFGQGVTATVYCGAGEDNVTITPLSKYVNATSTQRQIAAARSASPEVSNTFRFATSIRTSDSSDFLESSQATKVVNGRTGIWLTNTGSDGRVASNQDESTFSSSDRSNYVFSQDFATKSSKRGFYKVNNSTTERIVFVEAISARSAQMETVTTDAAFKVRGVQISDIDENCEGKNFVVSAYGQTGEALFLVNDGEGSVNEVAALWDGSGQVRVSGNRTFYSENGNISATQTGSTLTINFVPNTSSNLLNADSLTKFVIETQENALSSNDDDEDEDED